MAGVGGVPQDTELSGDPSSINSSTEKSNSDEVSSQEDQIPPPSIKTEPAQIQCKTVESSYPEETRLSGWLAKVGALGFVKTSRLFWFVFGDDTCKLYYYRNPQDLLPLGEIDISNAFFTFDPNVTDKPGLFEIRSEGKIHYLDAQERHKMVYWLQELQRKRREYSQKRTTISSERVQWTVKKRLQISGLLGDEGGDEDGGGRVTIEAPMDNIQVEQSFTGSKIPQWNLKREIRDAVISIRSNFKSSGQGIKETQGTLTDQGSSREDWTLVDNEVPPTETLLPPNNTAAPSRSCPDLQSPTSPVSKSNPQGKFMSTFKKLASKRSNTVTEGVYKDQRNKVSFPTCVRCKHINEDLITARDDLQATEEELQAHREIVKLLQKQVDVQRTEINTMREAGSKSSEDQDEMLRQRDKHIVEMRHSMSSMDEECSQLKQHTRKGKMVKIQDTELKTQREQLVMYQDMLEAKDQILMKLTNQIYELEKIKGQNSMTPEPSPTLPTATVIAPNTKELETLRDSCHAYELQNKFLTKEILELNQLRQNDEAREKMLLINYAKLEADYYKTKSRYLILLKENQTPVMGGSESTRSQEIVNQLLQEAMDAESGDADNKHLHMASNSTQEYDRYGFQKCLYEEDEDILLARADQLQRQSAELANNIKVADEASSHQVKWENFMVNQSGRPLNRSLELKTLIRSGIPHEYREQLWKGCINMHIGQSRQKLGPGYYKSLVVRAKDTKSNPAAKQIELDLLRTLPNNRHFETLESDGIKKLRRILLAFSAQNMVIGYCQGLNRLAAIALLFLSEEEAFWCLVTIVEHLMPPDYFTTTLAAAQADQRVLKDLVQDKLPKLYSHFETHDVDLSLFTFNWFLTVFVDSVPTETFLRVWDSFLYEGSKVLFRFAIAFLKYAEEGVLTQNTSFLVNRYMRTVGERMTDARGICKIAFHDLNPFPMRSIASKRQSHLNQIKIELAELDAIRRDFKSERVPDDRMDFYSDDEIDDA